MGKLYNSCGVLILEAMKSGDKIRKNAYTNMKAAFLKYKTSAEGAKIVAENGGEISDEQEVKIVKKMVKELHDAAKDYIANGRKDIADEYLTEASHLEPFLPKEATEEDIRKVMEDWLSTRSEFTKKDMGLAMSHVLSTLENCDGKTVSQIVLSYL